MEQRQRIILDGLDVPIWSDGTGNSTLSPYFVPDSMRTSYSFEEGRGGELRVDFSYPGTKEECFSEVLDGVCLRRGAGTKRVWAISMPVPVALPSQGARFLVSEVHDAITRVIRNAAALERSDAPSSRQREENLRIAWQAIDQHGAEIAQAVPAQ